MRKVLARERVLGGGREARAEEGGRDGNQRSSEKRARIRR